MDQNARSEWARPANAGAVLLLSLAPPAGVALIAWLISRAT